MAGKDINIPITGDAREFIRETENVEDALDDVADALDDIARETQRGSRDAERAIGDVGDAYDEASTRAMALADAGEDVGDETKRAADKAESAVDDLEDSFRDAAKRAKDLEDAGDDAGKGVKRGMDRAEEGVQEFKDEANSTAREAAASFDGSAESIADAFQEVAANAFAGFGPAGAVAGLAAAAGIGMAIQGFQDVQEAEEESRKRAAEWADAYIEAGGKVLSAATSTAKALDIVTDGERFKEATENAEAWGVDVSVAVAAMAGETWALSAANESLSAKEKAAAEEAVKLADGGEALADMLVGATGEARAGRDALDQLTGEMKLGQEQADAYSRYLVAMADHTEGATRKVDEFGDTIVTLPDGKEIYIDAETGQATENVEAIEKKIYGIPDGHAKIHFDTSQAEAQYNKWIRDHDGKSIKIYGRYITPAGDGRYMP